MTPQNLVPHTVTPFTETHTKKTKSHPYRKDVEECSNPLTFRIAHIFSCKKMSHLEEAVSIIGYV
jgi:hypothetical protein